MSASASHSKRIALGTRKGILIFEPGNGDWSVGHESFRGSHVSMVHLDRRSGNLFACLDDGHFGNKLFRWSDFLAAGNWREATQAEAWHELTAPQYPATAKLKNGNDAVLCYQWAFANGAANQPGRLYVGTEPGGLFYSDNHGDEWHFVESLWNHPSRLDDKTPWMGGGRDEAGIHSICVDPRDANRLILGISVAGVFVTDDGMKTWRPCNSGLRADFYPDPYPEVGHDPHLVVQCRSQPDGLWQQNHCGIFRSVDGAKSWRLVSQDGGPAHFGFAVAVDPDQADVAWVVPAESDQVRVACHRRLVVCRTDDGGQTWSEFDQGLPQHNCYDFAFRHCLVLSGEDLIFGTACGSLYHSRDRGESWDTIANHLPPIYCVHVIDTE